MKKYSIQDKIELGKLVAQFKDEYEASKNKQNYNSKRKVFEKPKSDYVARAVRVFYDDMKNYKGRDPEFLKALSFARRCYNDFVNSKFSDEPPQKRFRAVGGGRKIQAPEVREALFFWFIDIRGTLKGRLPKKILIVKAKELYQDWLKQQPVAIDPEKQLKFTDCWIYAWMKEYEISLQKPNKRFFRIF